MLAAATVSGSQMMIGLVVGVGLLVFLVLKTKIHAFQAMILAASVTGIVGGMATDAVSKSVTTGFGNTLGSIGLVIGFGVMMGRILEVTGAAERMAYTFLKWFGKKRPEIALALTGYMVSIPIFVDSGFVILNPLAKALARRSGKSMLTMGISLAVGLAATHHLVPPTPGPLGAAGIFGADIGQMILWGMVFAVPVMAAGVMYATWVGRKIYQIPSEDGTTFERGEWSPDKEKEIELVEKPGLPSAFLSFLPILAPVVFIIFNTVLVAMKATDPVSKVLIFLGQPTIAVLIGLILAIYGLGMKMDRKTILKQMEVGVESAGIIMLVTGAGGALGQVVRDSGAGNYLAEVIAASPVPAILLPFVVATLIRLVQGSGTVAMLTASSITAPILAKLGVNPVFAAQSAAMGAFVFSYFNDSLFWVVNRLQGIEDVKEQVMTWSIPTTIAWATSGVLLVIVNAIFG